MESRQSRDSLLIPFFEKQIFLLSGSTGFLGKLFLHKLLTSVPNLPDNSIYVIVRGKSDQTAQKRFEDLIFNKCLLFKGRLAQMKSKIKVIEGDMSERRLGMSKENYEEICERVTMIFHMAATVNFNENLRKAVELNVFGVKRMIELAYQTKNLKSFVHTSTTYVNAPRFKLEIKEKLYSPPFDCDVLVDKIYQMTDEEAELSTPSIIGRTQHPNTYTFTKFLAEHILMKEKDKLPLAIVRPCIIGAAMTYPLPGWVDSYTAGPAGVMLAAGLGAIHVMSGELKLKTEMIPVDIVVDTLIAVGYATANKIVVGNSIPIFHCATAHVNPTTWRDCTSIIMNQYQKHPGLKQVSKPWLLVPNPRLFPYLEWLLHSFPAFLLDKKAELVGAKANNAKKMDVMKKIIGALAYFTGHEWVFHSDNLVALFEKLNFGDRSVFNIDVSSHSIDWELYWITFQQGLNKFLMKDLSKEDTNRLIRSKL